MTSKKVTFHKAGKAFGKIRTAYFLALGEWKKAQVIIKNDEEICALDDIKFE